MARLRLAAVAVLALCSCLIHAPTTTGLEVVVPEDTRVAPPSLSCVTADDQAAAVVAGEAEEATAGGRMDLELEDYPGSGANDRHSPWAQQRRN